MPRVTVDLKKPRDDSYTIRIGVGVLKDLSEMVKAHRGTDRYVVISDSRVYPIYGAEITQRLGESGIPVDAIEIPAGEASKSMATVMDVVSRLLALNATRQSVLVALGGGVVGDLTGFVSSIFKRGIDYIQIATSLIAQVDSSVGGKTGVDVPEGKNLLGTFHHPKAVFIDPSFLKTLPPREFRNGLSEVIKYAIIQDRELFELLMGSAGEILSQETTLLESLIERSCKTKARIVEQDELEGDLRRVLNFGHTVGHALEAMSAYRLSHGEAVASGMVAAAMISQKLGHLEKSEYEQVASLIKQYDLPTTIPEDYPTREILAFMARDKKVSHGRLHFVLIENIGRCFVTPNVSQEAVEAALEEIRG